MDEKEALNHISKSQLFTCMIELGIDGDLITNRKVQLVINGHDNKERDIETGISQGSPLLPIFFLIYISGVFDKVSEINPLVKSLFFNDDL